MLKVMGHLIKWFVIVVAILWFVVIKFPVLITGGLVASLFGWGGLVLIAAAVSAYLQGKLKPPTNKEQT